MTPFRLCVLSAPVLLATTAASAACVAIPEQAERPAVSACEESGSYVIRILDEELRYDAASFQAELRDAVGAWLSLHDLPAALLDDAAVEIFLAVPEADPAATQARAQVHLDDGRSLIVAMSPRMEEWQIDDDDVGIADPGETYPADFGYRVARLLVEQVAGCDTAQFLDQLALHGLRDARPLSAGWWSAHVAALSERRSAARLLSSPQARASVADALTDSLVEWIAERRQVFAFFWHSP